MLKKIFVTMVVVIIAGISFWAYQSNTIPKEPVVSEENKSCESNEDCIVCGKDGDCNCGCFNRSYQWKKEGNCFCAAPRSCECVSGKCEGIY